MRIGNAVAAMSGIPLKLPADVRSVTQDGKTPNVPDQSPFTAQVAENFQNILTGTRDLKRQPCVKQRRFCNRKRKQRRRLTSFNKKGALRAPFLFSTNFVAYATKSIIRQSDHIRQILCEAEHLAAVAILVIVPHVQHQVLVVFGDDGGWTIEDGGARIAYQVG